MKVLARLAIAFAGIATGGQQGGGHLTEYPDVPLTIIATKPTANSITLSIFAKNRGNLDVQVFDDTGQVVKNLKGVAPGALNIDQLGPGQRYRYAIRQGAIVENGAFTTAKPVGKGFSFVVQADSHLDGNSSLDVYRKCLEKMVSDGPDFMVDLGDTFMVDKYPNYQDSAQQYQAQRYWFSRIGQSASVFLCLGNHDGEVGWRSRSGEDVAGWARAQREQVIPSPTPQTKGLYYSWDWGDASFIVLDPFIATNRKPRTPEDGWNWTLGREQYDWLTKTLANSTRKYKFVFIHHLVGGLGKDARGGVEGAGLFEWGDMAGMASHRPGWGSPIHQLLVKNHVTAVFHGHDHLYARQEKDGVAYIETPQPSFGRHESPSSVTEYGYQSGVILGSPGYMRVTVDAKKCSIEYVHASLPSMNFSAVDSITR